MTRLSVVSLSSTWLVNIRRRRNRFSAVAESSLTAFPAYSRETSNLVFHKVLQFYSCDNEPTVLNTMHFWNRGQEALSFQAERRKGRLEEHQGEKHRFAP